MGRDDLDCDYCDRTRRELNKVKDMLKSLVDARAVKAAPGIDRSEAYRKAALYLGVYEMDEEE